MNELKYPFNRQWTKSTDFQFFSLEELVDRLYKFRQMEEMWKDHYSSEQDYDWKGIKLCVNNIRYLDNKIAFEEDQISNGIKKTSYNKTRSQEIRPIKQVNNRKLVHNNNTKTQQQRPIKSIN